jgi:GMP synthase-like glutamine amidotransferase
VTAVLCLHHLAQPFLGLAEGPLRSFGLEIDERNVARDPLPALDEVDAILSFGGAQSAVGPDATLGPELDLLREAAHAGVPVLGICLGGQLLARALGARVRRSPRRTVAWHELEPLVHDPLFDAAVVGLHWNEDVFDLPEGAVEILGPRRQGVEAFRFGDRAWGVQFHPEVDGATLDGWYATYGDWLAEAGVTEEQARAADRLRLPDQEAQAGRLFSAFAEVVSASAASRAASR